MRTPQDDLNGCGMDEVWESACGQDSRQLCYLPLSLAALMSPGRWDQRDGIKDPYSRSGAREAQAPSSKLQAPSSLVLYHIIDLTSVQLIVLYPSSKDVFVLIIPPLVRHTP
jgi:hypothetical protein